MSERVGNICVYLTRSESWANLRLRDADMTWRITTPIASWDASSRVVTTASGSVYDLTLFLLAVVGGPANGANYRPDEPVPWDDLGFMPHSEMEACDE